jgi:hypothetical protein
MFIILLQSLQLTSLFVWWANIIIIVIRHYYPRQGNFNLSVVKLNL